MTGITGLVGAGFTTALLRNNPSCRIVSLCRGFCGTPAIERARNILKEQCEFDGKPETFENIISRVEVIEGTLENLPADQMAAKGPYDVFFHCAADVNLGKDPNGTVFATNLRGTKAALDLARKANIPIFQYVSTAYVAGLCSGRVMEDTMPATAFNNPYEHSKFEAEKMVRNSGFPFTIYRPSIIVGRLSDGKIRKPLAFYRILEFLGKLKSNGCAKMGLPPNGVFPMNVRLQAGLSDKIYFVPQDYVQTTISRLFMKPVVNRTYHITGDSPVATKWIEQAVCETLNAPHMTVQEKVENPTRVEETVNKIIGDLLPYFSSQIVFDSSNVRKDLGDEVLNWKMDVNFLKKMAHSYYMDNFPAVLKD